MAHLHNAGLGAWLDGKIQEPKRVKSLSNSFCEAIRRGMI